VQVEYLVTISSLDEGWDVNMIEEACLEAASKAAKQLFLEALKQREKGASQNRRGKQSSQIKNLAL